MTIYKKYFLIILTLSTMISCNDNSNNNYIGMDYRIFNNSPIEKLAVAVKNQNLSQIDRLVKVNNYNIDYQDVAHGNTLLMLSVLNHDFESTKKLIDLGADVNIHSIKSGTAVIHDVCGLGFKFEEKFDLLNLLLTKGANPNDVDSIADQSAMYNFSPIMQLCNGFDENQALTIKCIELLLNKGGNINFINFRKETALSNTLIFENYDVSLFLLKNSADHTMLAADNRNIDSSNYKTIIQLLNNKDHPINSEKYKKRTQIIKILNSKGIYE